MKTYDLTRRTLIRAALSSAALLAIPLPRRRQALAAPGSPHFLITCIADGGWDPTQVLDVHDPNDMTDGIDVDVPQAISGLPPSLLRTVGGLTYMSNPVTRPAVDAFFDAYAGKAAIINGINTRSTSHDQSRQLVLTGYLDPTKADFAVMAAHHNGIDMPLPHLLVSGQSFGGGFAGLSGRVGGQLGQVLTYNRIPSHSQAGRNQLGVSTVGEGYIQQVLDAQRSIDAESSVAGKLAAYGDASTRADRLVTLARSLPRDTGDGAALGTSLALAFRSGLTTSVTINPEGGFDTHSDNTQQNQHWNDVFTFLKELTDTLAGEPGVASPSMLDETTIVFCSEFGRTPELNQDNGKDHHPWTSMILVGKRVHGGMTVGMTDGNQEGVKTNFATGMPDDVGGLVVDVQNVVAGLITLVGANSGEYLPNVRPFTAMIA